MEAIAVNMRYREEFLEEVYDPNVKCVFFSLVFTMQRVATMQRAAKIVCTRNHIICRCV